MEDKILEYLKTNNDKEFKPSEIAFAIGFERPKNTASVVNPYLYSLLKKGKVIKMSNENGSNPRWKIKNN